jgi:hypothetical protein
VLFEKMFDGGFSGQEKELIDWLLPFQLYSKTDRQGAPERPSAKRASRQI